MLTIVPRFLRDPQAFFASIQRGEEIKSKVLSLAASSALFLLIYGFVLGLAHSFWQALATAVKMPILFMATMAFCLPALYFFSLALLSTRLKMLQVTAVVLTGVGVIAFLLLGLAPVTLFFVLTSGNYAFFQLLAVVFVAVSGVIGLYYLWRGMTLVDDTPGSLGQAGRVLLAAWIGLYAFVSSQMTWRLSPLVGDPSQPFVLLQPSRDNFYVDVIHAVQRAMGIAENAAASATVNTVLVGTLCLLPVVLLFLGIGVVLGARRKTRNAPPAATVE